MLSPELQEKYPVKTRNEAKGRVPWAYELDPEDHRIVRPVTFLVHALEEAFDHLEEGAMSLRQAVDFLKEKTGKDLSHQALNKFFDQSRADGETLRARKLKKQLLREKRMTREQRKEQTLTKKIQRARQQRTLAEKRIARLSGKVEAEVSPSSSVEYDYEVIPQDREVIFKPNDGPQTEFLASTEKQVLYGGAAGGGKSFALLADPMRYFDNKNFNGLLVRRTLDELRELIWKSKELYKAAYPDATWSEKKSSWTFPSGAQIWFSYLERDDDVLKYQGQAFTWIGFDELTQYSTPFAWNYLFSRLRTSDPELSKTLSMRATTNPGGPGHGWVKRMFIDPAPPGQTFTPVDIETGNLLVQPDTFPSGHPNAGQPNPRAGEPLFERKFIPASLYDNPYLTQDDSYASNLLSLPEQQRRQLLEGDWNVADGAAFSEFRTALHVVKPFEIPKTWRRFRSCDYGYSSFSAVHWYAIDEEGTLYVYRELYVSKKEGSELARMVLELERGERVAYGVLDSSLWSKRGDPGPSIAETMIRSGCRWRPSDRSAGSRVAGKNRLHQLLKVNEDTGKPGIVFFDTCRQIISDLPIIPADPKGSDDIDDRYKSDHAYDSIRYGIMTRPRPGNPWEESERAKSYDYHQPASQFFGY